MSAGGVAGRKRVLPLRMLVPALLLLTMASLLVATSLGKRLVYDEYDNLAYGYRVLSRGLGPPPSGQRMPVLALNALPCAAASCRLRDLDADEQARLRVRMPTMAFALMLAMVIHGWAGEMLGRRAALLALALLVFDPTVLAHGKQVTTDVATAFFTVFALWAFWRLLRGRGGQLANLLACALGTAGALAAKYTSVLLLAVFAILLVVELLGRRLGTGTVDRALLRARLRQSGAFLALVLLFVNAAYRFEGSFTRADAYDWQSRGLQALKSVPLPIPLPRVFVLGLDRSSQIQEERGTIRGYNYVLGQLNVHGVWYAFPLMVLLKTPLALFGLIALGAWRCRPPSAEGGPAISSPSNAVFLWTPFLVVLAFFSLVAEPQLGIRYLLPGLPFLALLAASAAAFLATARRRLVVGGLLGWYVLSSLSYFPHPMSYFNELIGPRKNAWRFLADSNLDWEDRTRDIERYRAAHPEQPLVVSPREPEPGYLLVSANDLVGIRDPERYRWLRESFRPIEHVGYSYLLFRVTPDALREGRARAPVSSGAAPRP